MTTLTLPPEITREAERIASEMLVGHIQECWQNGIRVLIDDEDSEWHGELVVLRGDDLVQHLRTIDDVLLDYTGNELDQWGDEWLDEVERSLHHLVITHLGDDANDELFDEIVNWACTFCSTPSEVEGAAEAFAIFQPSNVPPVVQLAEMGLSRNPMDWRQYGF